MATGDRHIYKDVVANAGTVNIQPAVGVYYLITDIIVSGEIQIRYNPVVVAGGPGGAYQCHSTETKGEMLNLKLLSMNDCYLSLYNDSGGVIYYEVGAIEIPGPLWYNAQQIAHGVTGTAPVLSTGQEGYISQICICNAEFAFTGSGGIMIDW